MSKIAFLFSGQGSHFVGMAKDFYNEFPYVRDLYLFAKEIAGFDIAKLSFQGPQEELDKTSINQLAIVMHSLAVLEVIKKEIGLERLNVVATAGLSLGEYTALHFVESLSLEDLVRLIKYRGLYMQEACDENPSGMVAVIGLDIHELSLVCMEARKLGVLDVANHLLEKQMVISGENEPLGYAIELIQKKGAKARKLNVAGAYHSVLMNKAAEKMEPLLKQISLEKPKIIFFSNVTGRPISNPEEIRENLLKQINSPVLWYPLMMEIINQGVDEFWELGPGKVLAGLMKEIDSTKIAISFATVEDIEKLVKN